MTKIIIGRKNARRECDVEEGNLLFLLSHSSGCRLGVLDKVLERGEKILLFKPGALLLSQPFNIPGKGFGGLMPASYLSANPNRVIELYQGVREIEKYCRSIGWKEHADWIKKLDDHNIQLPKLKVVYYIG